MDRFLLFPVFFPMLAGLFAFQLGRWQEKARDMFVLSATAMELLLVLTIWTNPELSQASVAVEGFCALGIRFQAGGFHTLMALLTAAGWLAASVFCREYMVHVHKRNRFYFFWMLTLGATMGVFLSADLFTAFVFFEVMSFTSFVLVIQTEEYQALKAGETYLAVAVIGGLAALAGLFLLYGQLGTLDLDRMGAAAAAVEDRTVLWAGSLLVLVGFGAKAGAFPLHIWLPTAHPAAPAPASAVLSGIIIKTGVYGILVLSTTIFPVRRGLGAAAGRHRGGDHGAGGGAGGVFHRPEAHPGLLLHLPDRLYSGGDGHDVPAGGAQRPGGGRHHPAHSEPLPH